MRQFILFWISSAVTMLLPFYTGAAVEESRGDAIRFNVSSWATENGLPQNSVNKVLQTSDGYLWIATNGGLARYNGETFTTFSSENTSYIKHNKVVDIIETRDGDIWIATLGGGLSIMYKNGRGGKRYGKEDGLIDNAMLRLYQDSKGIVWITTYKGLNYFENGKIKTLLPPAYNSSKGAGTDQYRLVYEDNRGDLWISLHNKSFVHRFYGGKNGEISVLSMEKYVTGLQPAIMIYGDRKNNIWISTPNYLFRYSGGRFFTAAARKKWLNIVSMVEDNAGNLWAGSSSKGLYRVISDSIIPNKNTGLDDFALLSMMVDREGVLWCGSISNGLVQLRKSIIHTWTTKHGLPHHLMLSLFQDNGGILWACTNGKGLAYFKNGRFHRYNRVRDAFPWSIFQDSKGIYWIGSYGGGLYRVENDRVTVFRDQNGLTSNSVLAIFEDSRERLWIGTAGDGAFYYKNGVFSGFDKQHGFLGKYVCRFFEDRNGVIWSGTTDNGVNRFENGTFSNYSTVGSPEPVSGTLSHDSVRSIYEAPDGALWFGTYGGGLNRLKNDKIVTVRKKNGLYSNIVSDILDDGSGYLWMTCNRGVYRARLTNLNDFADGKSDRVQCSYYNKSDGMVSAECNGGFQPSALKTREGKFWIPTIRGIAEIDPADANINKIVPNVVIEKMYADGKSVDFHNVREFRAGTRNIVFHYTALSFVNPGRVRFKCKLEGFEEKWNDFAFRRAAYYNQLAPGEYTFRVIGCNNDGVWNLTGAAVSFYLRPFFYQTAWFYLLIVITGIGAGIVIFQVRVYRLKNRKLRLQVLVAQQTRELREANEVAREEREAADAANRSKSEFLARMSHEIRTPLNSVIGFSELLSTTRMDEIQTEYVYNIAQSGTALLGIINDILDFSRIEAGRLSFDPVDFDPEVTAFDVCESILPRVGDRPIEVLCRIGDGVPAYIVQDPGRFRQVLINLMGNAVKFTKKGEIELSIQVEEPNPDSDLEKPLNLPGDNKKRVKLHCRVRDTGIGIHTESLETIFQVFQQADGSISRKYGGTGLGLPICKQIAMYMGGDITVESTLGKGSTFHFTALAGISRKTGSRKSLSSNLTGKHALVVDDNRTSLEIIEHMLGKHGMLVAGETSYSRVTDILGDNRNRKAKFDICIIDTMMPGGGGLELAKKIRDLPSPVSRIPLLALTSIGGKQSAGLRDAGFDGLLPKPVQHRKLLTMIIGLLAANHKPPTDEITKEQKMKEIITQYSFIEEAKQSVRILLVEDNPVNRKLANFLLTQAGYSVEFAVNGREGVEKYTSAPESYDLIFMDIQMPGMDGYSAVREIRGRGFCEIPIIAMTAESMEGDREKCLDAGMNDYIAKPIRRGVVFGMIKKWVLNA